ncbi:MAG: hypothetical protein ABJZ55_13765 [Fuerstiella sp.]
MNTTMNADQLAHLKSSLARDASLPLNNTVTASQLDALDEARDYDAASTYNFLFAELMVVKHAVGRGRSITIESTPSVTLDSVDDFMDWAIGRFPAFAEPAYHDLYIDPVALVWDGDR